MGSQCHFPKVEQSLDNFCFGKSIVICCVLWYDWMWWLSGNERDTKGSRRRRSRGSNCSAASQTFTQMWTFFTQTLIWPQSLPLSHWSKQRWYYWPRTLNPGSAYGWMTFVGCAVGGGCRSLGGGGFLSDLGWQKLAGFQQNAKNALSSFVRHVFPITRQKHRSLQYWDKKVY